MRTAFAIDFLLERTPEVFMLELLLAGHEDADIYCLAHAQGSILGPIERHRIIASPLSRFVTDKKSLKEKAWLIPSAARQLEISPEVEKLVVLSSGWAHTIKSSPLTDRYTWIYDWESLSTKLQGLKKVFTPYHKQMKRQALMSEKNLSFSSNHLAKALGHSESRVIPGAFKTEEFPIVPDEMHPGTYTHHLVLLDGSNPVTIKKLISAAKKQNIALKFLGDDSAYSEEKSLQDPNLEFIGSHCEATTAALTHGAKAVWALGNFAFPAQALGAHCCGRPVVVSQNAINQEFMGDEGVWYLKDAALIETLLAEVESHYLDFDKKSLRRHGLKLNERLFKSQMRDFCGKGAIFSAVRPSALLR